jgi:cobalamin biosynthesis protein CobT
MANKNTKGKGGKGAKKVAPNKVIPKKEDEVAEETETEETETEETTEDTTTEEGEGGSEEGSEEEGEEEDEDEEDEFADASAKSTKCGVYQGGRLVKLFNSVTHGADYKKIAKDLAKRLTEKNPSSPAEAKDYFDPKTDEPSKEAVRVVNASNSLIREFSLATHGKGYRDLADAFIEKHGSKRGYRIAV